MSSWSGALFALGLLFSLPLVADTALKLAGIYVFMLADPALQLAWGTAVQLTVGLIFYLLAYNGRRRGITADLLVAVGSTAAFLYSAYGVLGGPAPPGAEPLLLFKSNAVALLLFLAIRPFTWGRPML